MARVIGAIGLERVRLAVAELRARRDKVRDEPLLGGGHDDMGRDRRKEGRDGESGGESELHFEICARKYSKDYIISFCFFLISSVVNQIQAGHKPSSDFFYSKVFWIRTVKCIIRRIMSRNAAGVLRKSEPVEGVTVLLW